MDDPNFMDDEEVTEAKVLELGNKVLEVLGADEQITDIEPFQSDSLYLQIFQALFPQFDFEEIEPGKNEEEMAENITQLISLLEKNLLETDLSDIKASGIVAGDLVHIDEFLQVLLQVVFLMVQNQAEGEESEEELDSIDKKNRGSSAKRASSGRQDRVGLSDDNSLGELDNDDNNKDETDTQKIAADLGLNSPDVDGDDPIKDEMFDEANHGDEKRLTDLENDYKNDLRKNGFVDEGDDNEHISREGSGHRNQMKADEIEDDNRFSDLDFYGQDQPDHKQIIDDEEDEEALMLKQALKKVDDSPTEKINKGARDSESKKKESEKKGKKGNVDVMHDPLLPDDADFGRKKDKRARADSLGGGGSFKGGDLLEDEDDMLEINDLEDLDEEQKYIVLQHLFEEYQKDPDSFPPEQRELLEYEMMKLYQKADMEGELDEEDDFDDMRGASSGKKKSSVEKNSEIKAKPRLLQDESDDEEPQTSNKNLKMEEEDDDEEYMKDIINQQHEAEAEREEQHEELKQDMDDEDDHHDQDMDKEEDHQEQELEENEGEGEEEQFPIPIDEEEFNKLSPEQQNEMIMAIQQQMAQQQMEGEGEDQQEEMDPEYYNALQQQMLQQQQMAAMGMKKPKRAKKLKKKKRPSTAKQGFNPSRSRMTSKSMKRPGTAKHRKKSKGKSKKRRMQERMQAEWLQQQQQLAMAQQMQNYEPSDEDMAEFQQYIENLQDENGNQIELTEEQLIELQQQFFLQKQQEAMQEGIQQVDEDGNVVGHLSPQQVEALQQQAYMEQMQGQSVKRKAKRRSSAKRRGSKRKNKRTKKKAQQMDDQTAFLMMLQQNPELQQQFIQQQQMQQMQEGEAQQEEMYGVDKIEEEEMEESPMKPHPEEHDEDRNHERPTEESGEDNKAMMQQNMQDGNFDDENQQMLANMSPEEVAFYQQKAAEEQMAAYQQDENGQMYYQNPNMYMPNQGNNQENLNGMLKDYVNEINRKERRKKKAKKSKNRRRSFANMYGNSRTHNVNNMVSYKRGLELKQKIKRDVKQVKLVKKIYMLANEIERNRLQEEKRRLAEMRKMKKVRRKKTKNVMRDRYQEQLQMLRQSIENERMDRKIAKFARTQAMKEWKKDLSRRQPQMALSHGSYS
ncbi:unnamed protein product [Moneuplotes crassus]|uniref:DUF5745 domain-containing protein n=1 Tax=Euplotes crassus TaxID=5936 RepID=A0AAD1XKK0_EUPCR|nr:unnamed protein product [Moneuplotes crassus]